ncbi:hypothetical protein NITGR_980080 [Nitrospina gracilis 3/211]|uniref:Uncharacterized protein n=1 Tax=Nitrospina gracilis (strain 3/211) TaxID=1266370 RepID=M1YNY7_NITG3|nr:MULTISPECIES: hypothetical protein [Nitrospina]MCF8722073.1 hypothetical protein [Nitrospina sp. Nb-3]CCQ92205.1 hypothetical protein NITGR_980080 [Nitrospina gracilis 3/211]
MESRDENLEPDRSSENGEDGSPAPSPIEENDNQEIGAAPNETHPESEVEILRAEIRKNRREITVVKTMLYISILAVLGVTFYTINKTQVLHLKDLGTQLTLSQSQASLNLGVKQKTMDERIKALETALQQVLLDMSKKPEPPTPQIDHPGQVNRLEETMTGINGSLSLLKPESPMVRAKVELVKEKTEDMVKTYKEVLQEPTP